MTILEQLKIRLPIVQAPMAGVSTPAMAAAASNAGALGSISVGAVDCAGAAAMIASVRALTDRSFNVNVFCHAKPARDGAKEAAWLARLRPHFAGVGAEPPVRLDEIYDTFIDNDELLAVLLAAPPAVVSFHFGIPSAKTIAALRNAGSVLFASATNVAEARAIAAAGIDAIVAQGFEAGGHRGVFDPNQKDACLSTHALTELLVRECKCPIIAAGGIMNGKGINAALALGADAVQLGTAFIGCPESSADAGFLATLKSDAAHHTRLTRVISGRPARCLKNAFTTFGETVAPADVPDYPVTYSAGKALHAAAKAKSNSSYGAYWAGQGAPHARSMPVAELIRELEREMAQ